MSYFTEKVEFRLTRPHTQHPTLYFTIPRSFLSATSTSTSKTCSPYLLAPLPPSIFLDPFSFPPHSSTIPQGIETIHLLGPIELEKPVGWSLPKDPQTGGARSSNSDPLSKESTAVLAKLSTIQQRGTPQGRTDGVRELEVKSPWDAELEDRREVEEIESFGIPLHARYLPPRFTEGDRSENTDLSENSTLLDYARTSAGNLLKPVRPLLQGLTRSAFKDGYYQKIQLEVPSFFWACENDGKAWDMLDEVQKVASVGWDLTDTSTILPSTHQHLLPLLSSHLPSHPYPQPSLLRPVPPLLSALQLNTLSTRLPVGDLEAQGLVQGITALVILFSAAWCMIITGRSIEKVDRAEQLG